MRCTTGRPSLRGRAPGSPSRSTSRSSTTDGDCTRPWATAPHSKRSPTTELRRPPQRDQPEDLSKILDTAQGGLDRGDVRVQGAGAVGRVEGAQQVGEVGGRLAEGAGQAPAAGGQGVGDGPVDVAGGPAGG